MQTVASSLGFGSVSVWCGILDWASALMTKGKKKKRKEHIQNTWNVHRLLSNMCWFMR